ncbi:siderophore-interacting protein, partial [Escherichia coli]
AIVSIRDEACKGYLAHLPEANIDWVIGHDAAALEQHLQAIAWPTEDYFVWITGEGKVVKNLSARFETEAFDQQRVRAAAYWHQRR